MSATTALAAGGRGLAWLMAGALWAAVVAYQVARSVHVCRFGLTGGPRSR
jgi:hypothetical protein